MARSRLGHCPNCIFKIARCTNLARNKHVEREMEGEAELIADYHSASWKSQNETPRIVTMLQQVSDKLTARFFPVLENHRHSFFLSLSWISLRERLDKPARDA